MDFTQIGMKSSPEFLRSLFLSLLCSFLYVNDMPNFTTGTTLAMFADDSKCYKCNESPDDFDTIQTDLNHLQRWSLANEMTFQPKKFENLRVSRKRTSPRRSYSIDGTCLKVASSVKDISITVIRDLTWPDHARYLVYNNNNNNDRLFNLLQQKLNYKAPYRILGFLKIKTHSSRYTSYSRLTPCLLFPSKGF